MTPVRSYLADLFERTVATYVEGFLGLVIAGWVDAPGVHHIDTASKAAIAGIPAALAVLKAGLARFTGNPNDASLAPGAPPLTPGNGGGLA